MNIGATQTDRLVRGVAERSVPDLARAISLVENGRDGYEEILSALHPSVGNAHRLGITGPPGSGKSTLIEQVVRIYRDQDITVAVVAVDPTSPFTGGALLGDRIRMESLTLDPGVYIRSMASRGATGGLATTTREVCDVLDAFGFERVIIETVGVGQSELAIVGSADTTALVLVPESGDGVQVLKAGVMEIADLYLINKSDRPGADRLVQEVEVMLGIRQGNAYRHVGPHHGGPAGRTARAKPDDAAGSAAWSPPVLKTAAAKGEGIDAAIAAVDRHRAFLESTGLLQERRRARLAQHTREVVNRALSTLVWERWDGEAVLAAGLDDVVSGRLSPYGLARNIVADLQEEPGHGG
jgi:LAO/AO transport system kinase